MTLTSIIMPLSSSHHPYSITTRSNLINPSHKFTLFTVKPHKTPLFPTKLQVVSISLPLKQTHFLNWIYTPRFCIWACFFRLRRLVSEFRSLSEPIDRVKRLLHYATILPQLGELTQSMENRVSGCAAQVWVQVEMDKLGRMRFEAESDSEITEGFCACLIFLLNGSYPDDILKVKAEDLTDVNVGLPVHSRVNS